ncbi:MAG: hypothetical protein ABI333_26430 [bacterium]
MPHGMISCVDVYAAFAMIAAATGAIAVVCARLSLWLIGSDPIGHIHAVLFVECCVREAPGKLVQKRNLLPEERPAEAFPAAAAHDSLRWVRRKADQDVGVERLQMGPVQIGDDGDPDLDVVVVRSARVVGARPALATAWPPIGIVDKTAEIGRDLDRADAKTDRTLALEQLWYTFLDLLKDDRTEAIEVHLHRTGLVG